MLEGIPASILAKHFEMAQIAEALEAHREGNAITTQCHKCGQILAVTDMPEVGSLWVQCPNGDINYHSRYSPKE